MTPWRERLAWRERIGGPLKILCAKVPAGDWEVFCETCFRWRLPTNQCDWKVPTGEDAHALAREHLAWHADPNREQECRERWPEAEACMYDPRCCRFPKSCSVE